MRPLGSSIGACLIALLSAGPTLAAGVIFRYLPGNEEVSSVVVTRDVEDGPYLEPREMPARGPGGWGFSPPVTAEFAAPGSTLRSESLEAVSQPLGPNLTIEAWIRPLALDGRTHVVGNQIGANGAGFLLGVEERRAFLSLRAAGTEFNVTALPELVVGEKYWLAGTVRYESRQLHLKLYVNGTHAAATVFEVEIPSPYEVGAPILVGTRAESGIDLTGTFSGLLYGAVVRKYVARESYLGTPPPFDGSTYFGLPAFHDYPVESPLLEMDQRIDDAPVTIRDRLFLPYINDEYVPQGTATRIEVSGADTTRLVYAAYYHRTRAGATGEKNSIVSEIVASTGRVRRTFRLTGRLHDSHAGGIAAAGGALFVSSAGTLERYPIPEYEGVEGPKYLDLLADPDGTVSVESKASFVSEFRDTLWVGDYRTVQEQQPYLYGYPLDESGRPVVEDPVVYALPPYIQGIDFFEAAGDVFAFLSRNRGSTEAEVLRYRPRQLDPYAVREPDSVITMPHGIEDLSFFDDGRLWTNSESGADFYQKGSPSWSTFYPFIYSVPPQVLFPTASHTSAEREAPRAVAYLQAYPNPANGAITVELSVRAGRTARVLVYDLLGRAVVLLYEGPVGSHPGRFVIDTDDIAPGAYFVVAHVDGLLAVRAVHVMR